MRVILSYYGVEYGADPKVFAHYQIYRFESRVDRDLWVSAQPKARCERDATTRAGLIADGIRRAQLRKAPLLRLGMCGFMEIEREVQS